MKKKKIKCWFFVLFIFWFSTKRIWKIVYLLMLYWVVRMGDLIVLHKSEKNLKKPNKRRTNVEINVRVDLWTVIQTVIMINSVFYLVWERRTNVLRNVHARISLKNSINSFGSNSFSFKFSLLMIHKLWNVKIK